MCAAQGEGLGFSFQLVCQATPLFISPGGLISHRKPSMVLQSTRLLCEPHCNKKINKNLKVCTYHMYIKYMTSLLGVLEHYSRFTVCINAM